MRSWLRLILILQLSAPAAAQAANGPTWQVRLADGSDMKLSVTANAEVVEFRKDHAVELSVPARSITEITHLTSLVRRSTKAHNSAEHMCCGGTDSHLTSLLALAIAAPMGSARTHYVEVRWHQDADRAVILELGKGEYLHFMDWLQQLSGTKWRDIALEREQAVKGMQQHAGSAWQVDVRDLTTKNYGYRRYSVLPLDENDETQLYFFDGPVKPQTPVAILSVTRVWSMNRCVYKPEVLYGDCYTKSCDLEAVMLPTSTYYVLPRRDSIARDPASDHDGSCDELEKQEAEWRLRLRGLEKDNQSVLRRSRSPQPPEPQLPQK